MDKFNRQKINEWTLKDRSTKVALSKKPSFNCNTLIALNDEFKVKTEVFLKTQAVLSRKNFFYKEYIEPSLNNYNLLKTKYHNIGKYLSSPEELLPFICAQEIYNNKKLTTITKNIVDTLNTTYNLNMTLTSKVHASTAAFMRYLVEGSKIVELTKGKNSVVQVTFIEGVEKHNKIIQKSIYEPMITKPIPHTNLTSGNGGYLTIHSPLLKHPLRQKTYDFDTTIVNSIQETPYVVNKELLELFDSLGLLDISLNDDYRNVLSELKTKSLKLKSQSRKTTDSIEQKLQILSAEKYQMEYDAVESEIGVKMGLLRTIELAQKYVEEEEIYFPVFVDSRGRIYTYCTDLSVQGNKLSKSLLMFKNKLEVNEEGYSALLVALGAITGRSKGSFKERYKRGEELLLQIDKFFEEDDLSIIDEFEDIYGGLALILEIYNVRTIDNYESGFICYTDASASGTQICSIITKSVNGCKLGNIGTTDETITDAYTTVSQSLKEDYLNIAKMDNLGEMLFEYLAKKHTGES